MKRALTLAILLTLMGGVQAHDPNDHSPFAEWAKKQQVALAAKSRFCPQTPEGQTCSCCDQAEVVKTRFRKDDTDWWYLHPTTQKWHKIPWDIIHEQDEETPTGEPVLFIYQGVERCFFIGRIDG